MPDTTKNTYLIIAIIIAGATAILSQIVLLREIIILFQGNELMLGPMLAMWLLINGLGSWLTGRSHTFLDGKGIRYFFIIQWLLCFVLPATIYVLRLIPQLLNWTWGELVHPMIGPGIIFLVIFPLCFSTGSLFPIACSLFDRLNDDKKNVIPTVFFWESLGSGLAALLIGIFMISFFETRYIVILICSLNVLSGAMLAWHSVRLHSQRYFVALVFIVISIAIVLSWRIDSITQDIQWRPYVRLADETTRYGHITVTQLDETIQFHENGNMLFSYPDEESVEETVHFPMLYHPAPKKILLMSGGLSGAIDQILKHPTVEKIDYVELDPELVQLGTRLLPNTVTSRFHDPRLHIIYEDGRAYLRHIVNTYDVVILQLPEPTTIYLNRFYTIEFYNLLATCLSDSGVIGFQIESSENVIGHELSQYLTCMCNTLQSIFQNVIAIPGNKITFIASKQPDHLSQSPDLLIERIHTRYLRTTYIQDYFLPFRMSPDRIQYINHVLNAGTSILPNRDLRPSGYLYKLIVWSTYFSSGIKRLYDSLSQIKISAILGLLALGGVVFIFFVKRTQLLFPTNYLALKTTVACMGYTSMSLQILLLLLFQTQFGFLYLQIAFIMTGFMAGLSAGTFITLHANYGVSDEIKKIRLTQLLMCVFIIAFFIYAQHLVEMKDTAGSIVFTLMSLLAGLISGYQYPIVNQLYVRTHSDIGRIAGSLYALDLLGACFGALLTSLILIPLYGILNSVSLLFIVNGIVFIVLIVGLRVGKRQLI
ncbi:hypothetical protein JW960_16815 [candidate division KSB1 bacterium]|nr:hypothetical protein [candidate division KSB1 bacterium]